MIQNIQDNRTTDVNTYLTADIVTPLVDAGFYVMGGKKVNGHSHRFVDLSGQKFGRWTVLEFSFVKGGTSWFKCRCECGVERNVKVASLNNGASKSCGCLHKENFIKRITKHGHVYEDLFKCWRRMLKRCYEPSNDSYSDYGGRGITVCEEWRNCYESFRDWSLSNGYIKGLSVDRINNDGNYCPDNCRWSDWDIQANNKRNNVFITHNGVTLTIAQWSRELGIKQNRIRNWNLKGRTLQSLIDKL